MASAGSTETRDRVLTVDGLSTVFRTDEGVVNAVDGVDFALEAGELCSIIGPNGAGKTT
ncbi:ATP-binding cassette domain-containing protein, partial [Halorubrum sp. SP3]|uniref:ATP-binding cassette domain-containing protein n=1 Tax=Halorubrum sp. SP3 TaxID=1537265 RepID=UPI0034E0987C